MPSSNPSDSSTIKFVVIDLDHTIVASRELVQCWLQACQEGGLRRPAVTSAFARHTGGTTWGLLEALGISDEQEQDAIIDRCWTLAAQYEPQELPGALDGVRFLASEAKLFLSTASPLSAAQRQLDALGVDSLFESVLGSRRDFRKGPAHFAAIADSLGLSLGEFAQSTMTIGDGLRDMSDGERAGFPWRVGVTTLHSQAELLDAGATLVVDRLDQIPQYWTQTLSISQDFTP